MPRHGPAGEPLSLSELHDLARGRERLGDWPGAEAAWRRHLAASDSAWWAHVGLARALVALGRGEEADAWLRGVTARFAGEPHIEAALARRAEDRGDWEAAERGWEALIDRFPARWEGYRGKIAMLARSGRPDQADALLERAAPGFPDDQDAIHDRARLAERRRDWPAAEAGWRRFVAANQAMPWAWRELARALRQLERLGDAAAVLEDALGRFPAEPELALEAALVARRQGRGEAADGVIAAALARRDTDPALHEALGLNAMAREDWPLALARFQAALRRFPADERFRQRVYEVRLRLADSGADSGAEAAAGDRAPEDRAPEDRAEDRAEDRELVSAFESLGGGGHGCEFGIFQRHFGAEPLGLLRWADIYQDQLARALETEFAGVGEAEFTQLFVPDGAAEYWTVDTRYHMAMRCFVPVADVPYERMTRQVIRRLRFLRAKLIEDLREARKIFVYKNMKRDLTEAELARLHAACRRYGDNTLLYIRYQDATHPAGEVRRAAPGLLVAAVEHFSHTPDTDLFIGPATEPLLAICRRAHALWLEDTAAPRA
jgi:tetratricopeptide (TPR) repeat protein